ncbi:MAG: cytidine/deoxycytidylate deaminase family protein [Candidatus Kerfeldbacteria bacterium]|nr:cytidine/deoxycytidylate deaminase family protein [Candidatus Kerfeldbacteria bacterium]
MTNDMTEVVKHVRPSWDDYFMSIARIVSTRATCDRLHTGTVLVKDKRIVSTGYNGSPPGLEHCDDVGHLMEDGHCVRTVHGEHNALLQVAAIGGVSTRGTTLYMLYAPCIHCCKYIVAAGVAKVVIWKLYRGAQSVDYLRQAGLEVHMYTPSTEWGNFLSTMFAGDVEDKYGKPVNFSVEK